MPQRSDIQTEPGATRSPLPSLFLFPGMGGYDPEFIRLGSFCEAEVQPVAVAYPHWTVLFHKPGFDLDALVGAAVAQIVAEASPGPVLLAGYSFGGLVAFAAAARLRELGSPVGFLGLLDIEARPGNDDATGAIRPPMTRGQELSGFLAALRRGDGAGRLAYVLSRRLISPRWRPLLRLWAGLPRRRRPSPFTLYLDRDLLFWHLRPLLRQWACLRETLPKSDAQTFLFRTVQHADGLSADLDWAPLCPGLSVVRLPGTHLSLVRMFLPQLGAAFRQAIVETLAPAGNAQDADRAAAVACLAASTR